MSVKSELRKELKKFRKTVPDKNNTDDAICRAFLKSDVYLNSNTILFYAALEDEINIDLCIMHALESGKKAALPLCVNSDGDMDFYLIDSLSTLVSGSFGVREPNPLNSRKLTDFSSCVCVVPAIAYDKKGFRLGYGKGYYDRFLARRGVTSVGLCYDSLLLDALPADKYDIAVDYIITQSKTYII